MDRFCDSEEPVSNNVGNLRRLLTQLYVAVLGHLAYVPELRMHDPAVDDVLTSVLDAAEGRPFRPIPLPWPPFDGDPLIPAEAGAQV